MEHFTIFNVMEPLDDMTISRSLCFENGKNILDMRTPVTLLKDMFYTCQGSHQKSFSTFCEKFYLEHEMIIAIFIK